MWQDNPLSDLRAEEYLLRYVRESRSQAQLPNSTVVPDMTFYLDLQPVIRGTGTGRIEANEYRMCSVVLLRHLARYDNIITNRLHVCIMCAMLKIPFAASPGSSHKILGLLEDMGVPQNHYESMDDAEPVTELSPSIDGYVAGAAGRIDRMFEEIKGVVEPAPTSLILAEST